MEHWEQIEHWEKIEHWEQMEHWTEMNFGSKWNTTEINVTNRMPRFMSSRAAPLSMAVIESSRWTVSDRNVDEPDVWVWGVAVGVTPNWPPSDI